MLKAKDKTFLSIRVLVAMFVNFLTTESAIQFIEIKFNAVQITYNLEDRELRCLTFVKLDAIKHSVRAYVVSWQGKHYRNIVTHFDKSVGTVTAVSSTLFNCLKFKKKNKFLFGGRLNYNILRRQRGSISAAALPGIC